ncbi:MAG: Fe-S cluster assembly protein HesB [Candidatus Eremiobacteraeota bacterium]|nr:Fe-S cluster assembly protein HesB [Candidatus Eremiobacteraeota bacterium]
MRSIAALPLRGPSGEPIDFARTIHSHGCTSLLPAIDDESVEHYRYRMRIGNAVRTLHFEPRDGNLIVSCDGPLGAAQERRLLEVVRRMFRLDEDFGPFYDAIRDDPDLAWASVGAGRLLASPTVFEDVVKTICTTNCAWSGTVRMVRALVENLGKGAFPTPEQMAQAPLEFYTQGARAGYRGAYLRTLAEGVVEKRIDLEALRPSSGMPDQEAEERLLALPGIGPYACAHIMLLLGRYGKLVFDSWTRPKYLKISGKRRAADKTIERRFKRYGRFAGLAFWLLLTRDWLD